MPAKRVLFLVNGLGIGISTRCYAVIQRLAERDVEIQVITSGNGTWFFPGKPEVTAIHAIKSLTYGTDKEGRISILNTFAHFRQMVKTL